MDLEWFRKIIWVKKKFRAETALLERLHKIEILLVDIKAIITDKTHIMVENVFIILVS